MMRILVAYDGSFFADRMLDDLRWAGLPAEAEVLVLSVAERWLPREDGSNGPVESKGRETAHQLAERAAQRLRPEFSRWSLRIEAATGSAAVTIVRRAEEWKADLIVLGSLGRSALERLLIGSVSYKVANEAPCSVRISRGRGAARDGMSRILVGYDGMEGSEAAVRAVAGRDWASGASVLLLTAVGFGYSPVAELSVEEDHQRARQIQAPAERMLLDSGLQVSPVILEGDPKVTIVEQANLFQADAIFIGNNNRGLAYRVILGTVASAIVPRAGCTVEVVRT